MNVSRSATHSKTHAIPKLRFEEQEFTPHSGLIIFQRLFDIISLKKRLRDCFRHMNIVLIFGYAKIVILLVIHMLLWVLRVSKINYVKTKCYEVYLLVVSYRSWEPFTSLSFYSDRAWFGPTGICFQIDVLVDKYRLGEQLRQGKMVAITDCVNEWQKRLSSIS